LRAQLIANAGGSEADIMAAHMDKVPDAKDDKKKE